MKAADAQRKPEAAQTITSSKAPPLLAEISLSILYLGAPFYSWPHKTLIALLYGSPYPRAYRHFRSAHSKPLNIFCHLVGLLHAVAANSALLHALDQNLLRSFPYFYAALPAPFGSWATLSTANVCLTTTLLLQWATSAPVAARLGAVGVVLGGYAGRAAVLQHWRTLLWLEGVFHILNLKYGDAKAVPILPQQLGIGIVTTTRYGIQGFIGEWAPLEAWSTPVNCVFLLLMAWGSYHPFDKALNIYWSAYVAWVLALLTGQPWLYLHGAGLTASLFQGVSHEWSGEGANLPELAKRSGMQRAGDEIAHMAYFPVLILHSLLESLFPKPAST